MSVSGRYRAMAMPGQPDPGEKDDQAMLAALTASPSRPYYWKLVGSKATVTANTQTFRTLLSTMKLTK